MLWTGNSAFDAIIVGSGPAGVAAAMALRGKRVLILDVGKRPPATQRFADNLDELRRQHTDLSPLLLGDNFESLHNLHNRPMSLKLKSPGMRFITSDADNLSPLRSQNFDAAMSFAAGGLANGWGAGLHRYTAKDLEGFPLTVAELDPFYDELTRHIGISGAADDLEPWFGGDADLQPAPELSVLGLDLLTSYQRHRGSCNAQGVTIGRARNAVLTRPHRGRPAYSCANLEFFQAHDPAVYNPAWTLRELIAEGAVQYLEGRLVLRYAESEDSVDVVVRNLSTGQEEKYQARALILAAGALNSAKLALESARDCHTRLPILDNPMAVLPIIRLSRIGQPPGPNDSSFSQLTLLQEFDGTMLQGSIYGSGGPLRSDILFALPLAVMSNVAVLRQLAAATGAVMLFFPAQPHPENWLRLAEDGALETNYGKGHPYRPEAIRALIPVLRRLGFFTSRALCQYPAAGASIHYAGTLPMKESPGRYESYADGRLFGTRAVYVADGACFPKLPAKNLSFTIMANAMRIAALLRSRML